MVGKTKVRYLTRNERKMKKQVDKYSNRSETPLVEDAQIHLISHVNPEGKEIYVKGPVYRLNDVQGAENKDDGISLYQIGEENPTYFLAPDKYPFLRPGKWRDTIQGKRWVALIVLFLASLFEAWQLIYLPKLYYIDAGEMFLGKTALVIWTAIILSIVYVHAFRKKTTAHLIELICFDSKKCSNSDVHAGYFVGKGQDIHGQIQWWREHRDDVPQVLDMLNTQLVQRVEKTEELIREYRWQAEAKDAAATVDVINRFVNNGIISTDDYRFRVLKNGVYVSISIIIVLVVLLFGGGR